MSTRREQQRQRRRETRKAIKERNRDRSTFRDFIYENVETAWHQVMMNPGRQVFVQAAGMSFGDEPAGVLLAYGDLYSFKLYSMFLAAAKCLGTEAVAEKIEQAKETLRRRREREKDSDSAEEVLRLIVDAAAGDFTAMGLSDGITFMSRGFSGDEIAIVIALGEMSCACAESIGQALAKEPNADVSIVVPSTWEPPVRAES